MLFRPKGGIAVTFLACALSLARVAVAQTGADLESGRKLFTEALAEEERKSYQSALDKYRRVQEIKDTANVRYRIAVCLDRLGHPGAALTAYEAAVTFGENDPANAAVVGTAKGRATELRGLVAELTIVTPTPVPPAIQVEVDGSPIDGDQLDRPLILDPGDHKVLATAKGFMPFRSSVTLPQAGHASIQLAMPALTTPAVGGTPEVAPAEESPVRPTVQPEATRTQQGGGALGTAGWITLTVGAVAGAGAIALGIDRAILLSSYNDQCSLPHGYCPTSSKPHITSLASTINTEGNMAPVVGGAAAALFGAGLIMVLTSNRHPATGHVTMVIEPVVSPGVLGLVASGTL